MSAPVARRTTRWLAVAVLGTMLPCVGSALSAQELCAGSRTTSQIEADQAAIHQLVRARDFRALESELRQRQANWLKGQYSEEALYYAYESFDVRDVSLEPLLVEWQQVVPDSAAAATARGIHAMELGRAARGIELRDKTSEAQIEVMRRWMALAQEQLQLARQLDRRLLPAYTRGLTVELFVGNRASAEALYREGLEVAPQSVYLRERYLLAIDARWFGSTGEVVKFLDGVLASDLPGGAKRHLLYSGYRQLAQTADTYDRTTESTHLYQEAAPMCEFSSTWQTLAYRYHDAGQWTQAIASLDQFLRLRPNNRWALRRKAVALGKLQRWAEALPLFAAAAKGGDSYAQNAYGWYLMQGEHVAQDLPAAIQWFERAAASGDKNAPKNLERARAAASQGDGT